MWAEVAACIAAARQRPFRIERRLAVGGGCINQAFRLEGQGQTYFIKINSSQSAAMFEAEADGLRALAANAAMRVPRPVCLGTAAGQAYLVLEWLSLGGRGEPAELGRALAAQHRIAGAQFGFTRDNFIGSTAQPNRPDTDWAGFFARHRLGWQLQLAARNGEQQLQKHGERLCEYLPKLIDHSPQPSLLHGDLWSGNAGYTADGSPAIFDPAVYFGDREADLAMTELFGGFPERFHAAYREAWPLDSGYELRRDLYNLYHVLNHFNLFGGGYAKQARAMIDRLLAAIGA